MDIDEKNCYKSKHNSLYFLQKKESTENQTIGEELPLVGGN